MTTFQERQAMDPGFRVPQCERCKHHNGDATCAAFPERIPDAIFRNEHDHTEPFPGDGGILFEAVASDSP